MHIPKTAGSSFRRTLQHMDLSLGQELCPMPEDQYFSFDYFRDNRDDLICHYEFIPGHYPYFLWEPLLDRAQLVTVFRDPLERCLSHIKHQIRLESDPSSEGLPVDTNDFIADPKNELFLTSLSDLMVKYMSYSGHPDDFANSSELSVARALERCEHLQFGFARDIDSFLERIINQHLDAPREKLQEAFDLRPRQRMVSSDNPFSVLDLAPRSLRVLERFNQLDLIFFEKIGGVSLIR